jgi:hypothetical protein
MIENAQGGLFVSTDKGETWTKLNADNEIRSAPGTSTGICGSKK